MNDPLAWMEEELTVLEAVSRRRVLREAVPLPDGWLELAGRRVLNLSSNDYLGLAGELPMPVGLPAGATASRLVVGNHPAFTRLERTMAELKGTEACLVFGSGYLANCGAIPALVGRGDTVFSDRLNHASIVDGIVLSRARLQRYRHNDPAHLEELLKRCPPGGRRLIITDAVFSMDGDIADLAAIVELKERFGAMLMVDEAHSGGVFGERGAGLAQALGLSSRIDVQMGTFSKAYGVYGGYVAGRRILCDYLLNHGRGFIFTTGLPPVVVGLIQAGVERAIGEPWRRQRLQALSVGFRQGLQMAGLDTGLSQTQIVPVVVGPDALAVAFSEKLLARGVGGVAIRPPTVPPGTARLRFSLSAAHREADVQRAVNTIATTARELGLVTGPGPALANDRGTG